MRNIGIYILLIGLINSVDLKACSCDTMTVAEALEKSDYIFWGQIIKAEFYHYQDTLFDDMIVDETDYMYTFKAIEFFKGDSIPEITVTSYYGSSCHFPMTHGDYYLVYTYLWKGHQRTGMCTRTKSIADKSVNYDFKMLRELTGKTGEFLLPKND